MQGLNWPDLVRRLHIDVAGRAQDDSAPRDELAWEQIATYVVDAAKVLARQAGLDDHQELAQEVLLRLQSADVLRRLVASGAPQGYLFVVIRNLARDLARRRNRENRRTLDVLPVIGVSEPVQEVVETDVRRLVAGLTDEERVLLRLRFWNSRSIKEIAAILGQPYSRVAVRLFRLLRRLRAAADTAGGRQSTPM